MRNVDQQRRQNDHVVPHEVRVNNTAIVIPSQLVLCMHTMLTMDTRPHETIDRYHIRDLALSNVRRIRLVSVLPANSTNNLYLYDG